MDSYDVYDECFRADLGIRDLALYAGNDEKIYRHTCGEAGAAD